MLLFTIVPLVELAILIKVAQWTSLAFTLVLVIITGIVGAALAKQQGAAVWARFSRTMQQGIMPADEIIEGIMIFVAGALLVTPGILTDITGFAILVPHTRHALRDIIKRKVRRAIDENKVHVSYRRF